MRQFLKFMLASMVGGFLLILLLIFLLIGIVAAISASFNMNNRNASVKDDSVLHITLDEEIVDRGEEGALALDFGPFKGYSKLGLDQILDDLDKAERDDRIKGIFLDLGMVNVHMASMKEIRDKLIEFKKTSGKPVIAYSEFYTQASYYLASAADQIYLTPQGEMDFRGMRAQIMFYKGLFDKLDVDVEFIKGHNNKYKSFGEAYTEEKMTPANHEQIQALIGGLWDHYLTTIGEQRKIDKARLNSIADSLLLRTANDAVNYGLVDGAKYRDEVLAIVKEKMGLPAGDKIEFAELARYTNAHVAKGKKEGKEDRKGRSAKVAVVFAQGAINSGENSDGNIGSETISAAIRDAREDSTVKAIVLRVNSPGGSGLASDVIWREVDLARQSKPVVVSMGDYAASGGYYISCAANKIYAEPTTITGSIGVFGIVPNLEGFLHNKLGLTFDGDKTNTYADMFELNRPMRDDERAIIQHYVDNFYDTFKERVAAGRHLSVEMVDSLGRGRVWTGVDAKARGLVDELGGLEDAIKGAAELAHIEDYKTVDYPEQKDIFQQLMEGLNAQSKAWVATQVFGDDVHLMQEFEKVRSVRAMTGIQARMPFEVDVR